MEICTERIVSLLIGLVISVAPIFARPNISDVRGYLLWESDEAQSLSSFFPEHMAHLHSAGDSQWNASSYQYNSEQFTVYICPSADFNIPELGWQLRTGVCSAGDMYISTNGAKLYAAFAFPDVNLIVVGENQGDLLCDFIDDFLGMFRYFNTDMTGTVQFPGVIGDLSP